MVFLSCDRGSYLAIHVRDIRSYAHVDRTSDVDDLDCGAEGWLGPNALGLTGPPNSLTAMVPIIIISLTVDYAIHIVSHYREQRLAGEGVLGAALAGFRHVTIPLALAGGTTIVSLLANLFSPIGIVADFGIIAGLGVGMSLVVMLSLVPASRIIIDRRREARGRLSPPRPI